MITKRRRRYGPFQPHLLPVVGAGTDRMRQMEPFIRNMFSFSFLGGSPYGHQPTPSLDPYLFSFVAVSSMAFPLPANISLYVFAAMFLEIPASWARCSVIGVLSYRFFTLSFLFFLVMFLPFPPGDVAKHIAHTHTHHPALYYTNDPSFNDLRTLDQPSMLPPTLLLRSG